MKRIIIALLLMFILALMLSSCKKEFISGEEFKTCIKYYDVFTPKPESKFLYRHCKEYRNGAFYQSFALTGDSVKYIPTLGCVKVWTSYPDGECIVCHQDLW